MPLNNFEDEALLATQKDRDWRKVWMDKLDAMDLLLTRRWPARLVEEHESNVDIQENPF
jgi:hypothetical protein